MADRPTAKEVSVDLAGFKDSVDKQIGLLTRLVFGLYALLVAIIGGGFLLRNDIGDLKAKLAESTAEVGALRRDLGALQTHVGAIEKSGSDLASGQTQILALQNQVVNTLAQMADRLNPGQSNPLFALSASDQQSIRDYFGIKGPATGTPKYRLGDIVTDTKPVPDALIAKVPGLRGFAFTNDPGSNSLVIVSQPASRVVAVISPV